MKKLMTPLVVAATLVLMAGCGGSDDPTSAGTPVAADGKSSAAALTQANFSAKVQAALAAKKTFQVVTTTTDADGPATLTTNVRLTGATADAHGTGMETTFVRLGGALYGKGGQLTSNPNKPWVKYDPAAKNAAAKEPTAMLAVAMLQLLGAQLDQYRIVAGAPYATKFAGAPGEPVDGVATTKYTMTVDLPKASTAKAFGQYLTADAVAQSRVTSLPVEITVDAESLPRSFAYEADGAKVSGTFGKFGDPVTITAPAAAEIA